MSYGLPASCRQPAARGLAARRARRGAAVMHSPGPAGVGTSRVSTPLAPTPNWRNPALYFSSATAAGSRWLQAARWSRHKAHADSSESGDEELAAGGTAAAVHLLERPPAESGGLPWKLMVALAAVSVLICYADRSNISTAIISMSEEYSWDAGKQGIILSAFFAGYICTQLLGGSLADKYGGKGVLAVGVSAWSLCTLFTPEAAAAGVPALVAMRVAMGVGEGVAFPAIHSLIARGVPVSHQSTSVAVVTAASYAGTALAFGVAPTIIDKLGWPWVFYLFGASAVAWLPFWLPLRVAAPGCSGGSGGGRGLGQPLELREVMGRSGGEQPRALGSLAEDQERERLWAPGSALSDEPDASTPLRAPGASVQLRPTAQAGAGGREGEEDVLSDAGTEWSDGVAFGYKTTAASGRQATGTGFAALMRTREVWAICAAQYTGSWGFYGLLTWLPTFFKDYYHVEIAQLAGFTLWPYVLQGGVGTVSGVIADKLLARGWSVRRVRRVLQAVGMAGPAACMLLAVSPLTDGSPSAASAWVSVGLGLNALTLAGVSVSHLDIAPKNAGVVFGAGNTAATAAGLLAVPVTGWVLATTHSWEVVFGLAALHYMVGAALFCWWVGGEVLPQDG